LTLAVLVESKTPVHRHDPRRLQPIADQRGPGAGTRSGPHCITRYESRSGTPSQRHPAQNMGL